jgi:hypothetical protein
MIHLVCSQVNACRSDSVKSVEYQLEQCDLHQFPATHVCCSDGTIGIVEQQMGLKNMQLQYTKVTYKSLQQNEANLTLVIYCIKVFNEYLLGLLF